MQNGTGGASSNAIGYTGQRLNGETGLMALGNGERYYSPQYARFIQQDSFAGMPRMPQSLNRFAYANNNPNRLTDPSGNEVDERTDKGFYKNGYIQEGFEQIKDRASKGLTGNSYLDLYIRYQAPNLESFTYIADKLTGGFTSRQDRLNRNYGAGKVTTYQYVSGTLRNVEMSPRWSQPICSMTKLCRSLRRKTFGCCGF